MWYILQKHVNLLTLSSFAVLMNILLLSFFSVQQELVQHCKALYSNKIILTYVISDAIKA